MAQAQKTSACRTFLSILLGGKAMSKALAFLERIITSKAFVIAEINLRQIKAAYYITGTVFLFFLIITFPPKDPLVSGGNALIILPVIAAILIPAKNFSKIINLGGKRRDFFKGAFLVYILFSFLVTLINLLIYYNADISYPADYIEAVSYPVTPYYYSYTIIEVIGFFRHGIVVEFIQMFVFLSSISAFTHTLTSIQGQGKWYVWVTTPALIIIAAVIIIAPSTLVTIFQNAPPQIIICLLVASTLYALSKPALARKEI
jgi:hypothetical protein